MMEGFDFKAPMYVNFGESALDEDDGADSFFDCEEASVKYATEKTNSADSLSTCSSLTSNNENLQHTSATTDGHNECSATDANVSDKLSSDVENILNRAMANLWTASNGGKTPGKQKLNCNFQNHGFLPSSKSKQGDVSWTSNQSQRDEYGYRRKDTSKENCQPKKFVSMAEAVRRFQVHTPDRFHSKSKNAVVKKMQHGTALSSTIPQTPHLTSHLRSRPVYYMTREEQEAKEAEEMKTKQVKARPLNPKILKPPKQEAKVERKPPTVPVPFNLTEVAKKEQIASPVYTFTARPVPTAIFEARQGLPKKKELPLTAPVSPVCLKNSKVYAFSLDVKDGVKCITEKEVHHFGIPTAGSTERKRTTAVQPFSFEERDKQLLKRKEETIKKYLEEEKKARQFHANPLPGSIKSPRGRRDSSITATQPVPFQFQVDRRGTSKQEQLKQKLEEEMRALQQLAQFKARPATVIQKKPFEPKKSERPLTDITAVKLNTEKRAKEREEFENKVRMEKAEIELLLQMRDEQLKKEEMEKIARLRKEAVHKARPVPNFKPPVILSSDNPLTDPHSPAFMCRLKKS